MSSVAAQVLDFYRTLPFNTAGSPAVVARQIRAGNSALEYPPLSTLLFPGRRVLDVGCGAGWLSNTIAYYFKCATVGLDFNPVAVEFAEAVARELGNGATFQVGDLFAFRPERPFDVVVSIGVLHHTPDCHGALRHVLSSMVRVGGFALIGLYHKYGRRPFLDHFAALRNAGIPEAEMFAHFRRLFGDQEIDETHARSWFRDQVLHPHETQHTLEELHALFESCGCRLVSTSLNDFAPFKTIDELIEAEPGFEQIGRHKLSSGQYFPGFFVCLVRHVREAGAA